MLNPSYLKPEELAVLRLRALYRGYGYLPYRMSKFEEYDLYVRNKDFLVSDRVITFTDVGGKLLALKPDVTLSIIKHGEDAPGCKQRVYYNENVYRVSPATGHFKELPQTGIECIGDLDLSDICEVVTLAAASLATVREDFVLDVSHMGVLSALMDDMSPAEDFRRRAAALIGEKNPHDLARLCAEYGISEEDAAALSDFVAIHGDMDTVLERLSPLTRRHPAVGVAIADLTSLRDRLRETPYGDRIRFDFSIMNDMNYYNGVVFCGFLGGVSGCALSGGQYNKLMRRMGRSSGAIGFALYLDLLESLHEEAPAYDVDVLLLYDSTVSPAALAARAAALRGEGLTVSTQRAIPEGLRYERLEDLRKEADQ